MNRDVENERRGTRVQVTKAIPLFAVGAALLVAGCGGPGTEPIEELPRELTVAERRLVEASNVFALGLFAEVARQDPGVNLFISPLSVSMALGMTYNGAAGATRDQMQQVLAFGDMTVDETNRAYRDLIDLLFSLDERVEFNLANSIWYRQGLTFEQAFLDVNREFFNARVTALNFSDPSAPATINDWVKEQTNGKIDKIVPNQLDDLVMFLINALYFKADWTSQFDESLTRDLPFTLVDGSTMQVPMMTHGKSVPVRLWSGGDVSVADLAYGGGAFTMTVLIPTGSGTVDEVIAGLDDARWAAITEGLLEQEIEVVMPKFTLEYETELSSVLEALGMIDAFDPDLADLTGMMRAGGLFIDHVKHKTFVDVNEEGTEAAAATSVGAGVTSVKPIFRVDRPFVFAIRERFSGTILFLGRMMAPGA